MTAYELFSHSDRFHYRSTLFSLATCFLILCTALTFLPPFLFAYFAGGYWIKESRYSEQPRVNYSSKYILMTENSDVTQPFFSSSFGSLNSIFQYFLIPATTTALAIDNNDDGVTDQFSITLQLPYGADAQIMNINLWLIFQYELRARQYINMETMTLINLGVPSTIDTTNNPNVSSAGRLILEQRQPIQSSGVDLTYDTPIIDLDSLFQTSSLNLSTVLDQYFTRKHYTTYQSEYMKWTYGTTSSITSSNILTISITIDVVTQSIRFIPGFWQEFKWGWIQYVCVLLPFIFAFNYIKEFVFRKQFVRTLVEMPLHRYKDK